MPGIKVSQAGYQVQTAADTQSLFNSSWPLLKTAYEGDYVISSDTTQSIYTHNLGYPTAFFVCDNTSGFSTSTPALNQAIGINANEIKYFTGTGGLSFPITIHFYIYVLDLTSTYLAPILKQSLPVTGGDGDFGIKVSKPSKDVSSADLRDFSIHSGTQSPMIHEVVSSIGTSADPSFSGPVFVSNHNLGYLPLFFPFISTNGYYFFTGSYSQSTPRVFGNTKFTQIELSSATPGCLVVFKDPYLLDVPTTVVSA